MQLCSVYILHSFVALGSFGVLGQISANVVHSEPQLTGALRLALCWGNTAYTGMQGNPIHSFTCAVCPKPNQAGQFLALISFQEQMNTAFNVHTLLGTCAHMHTH